MFEFDLADRVDDLICIFEGGNPDSEMDTISMLLTGWIIFFFCAVGLVKFIYRTFILKSSKNVESLNSSTTCNLADGSTETEDKKKSESIKSSSVNVVDVNSKSRAESAAVLRRKRFEKEQLQSQSFDISDKNKGPCNGPDAVVVEFVNRCYEWLYSPQTLQQKEWAYVRENFIDSINKTLREDEKTNPVVASVVDIVFKDEMTLQNCFAECEHENNVKVTCDCETQMTGVLSLYSPEKGTTRFDFFVDRLCGRLNILLDCEEEAAIVKFDGWPEIAIGIAQNTSPKGSQLDSKLSESIAEKLTTAIRNAVFEVEMKRFKDFPKAPRLSPKRKNKEAFKSYLVLKVIRGIDIGLQKGCEEPYCAVELDDPPQKFQTDCQPGRSPYWGENFVFNIVPTGGEILFEIFDRVGSRFMGCNILSIDEIGDGKNRPLTLPLKSRRMEISEQITGSVEVQFTFLDEKEFLQKSKEIIENVSPNGNLIKTTKTTFTKPPSAHSDVFTENVIKEFERNSIPNPNKSTLIIHAVQRVEKKSDGLCVEVNKTDEKKSNTLKVQESKKEGAGEPENVLEGQYGEERGRRRTRRGDIFTSIRRRFSKTRSRSVNPDGVEEPAVPETREHDNFTRSVSVDRDRDSLLSGGRALGIHGPHSTRSSASELSALSGHSTTTFIHENSTLVIESIENRIRKYYLVPPHLAEQGKWKKRGKKLHIFNDHTFVAKHIQSGASCEVCNGRFPFSLGKQGYQCRDCKCIVHKECHVRTPNYCSNTTVYDIELKVTRLGKISEENLSGSKGSTVDRILRPELTSTSSQQDNGDIMEEKSIKLISQKSSKGVDQSGSSGSSSCSSSKNLDLNEEKVNTDKISEQLIPNGVTSETVASIEKKNNDDGESVSGQITQVQLEVVATTSVQSHLTRSPKTDNLNLAAK